MAEAPATARHSPAMAIQQAAENAMILAIALLRDALRVACAALAQLHTGLELALRKVLQRSACGRHGAALLGLHADGRKSLFAPCNSAATDHQHRRYFVRENCRGIPARITSSSEYTNR
jgi:hypothetical protein